VRSKAQTPAPVSNHHIGPTSDFTVNTCTDIHNTLSYFKLSYLENKEKKVF
jgi:hypothetical protein